MSADGVHTFQVRTNEGTDKALSDYKGKALLIVNTASRCGYTPQYEKLQALYERYRDKGFEILAFPANDFGAQEPGTDDEIRAFCSTKYRVTFPLFSKIGVKGEAAHPLYRYLTEASGFNGPVTWNFNKFLVDAQGQVAARFDSKTEPLAQELVGKLETLLAV